MGRSGEHPNMGTTAFRAALALAPNLRASYLTAHAECFKALLRFILEADLLPTMHKNEFGVETWGLAFNRDGMYRIVKLDVRSIDGGVILAASPLAFRCEVMDGTLQFYPVLRLAPQTQLILNGASDDAHQLGALLHAVLTEASRYRPTEITGRPMAAPLL